MKKIINECVGCPDGCHGCGLDKTVATICDDCGMVCDMVFHDVTGDDLCIQCAVDRACEDFHNLDDRVKLDMMNIKEDK